MQWKIFTVIGVALSFACAAKPTSLFRSALVERHVAAIGGAEALSHVETVERAGTISFAGGKVQGTYLTCLVKSERVLVEIDAGPAQVRQAYVDGQGYVCQPGFTACAPDDAVTQDLAATWRDAYVEGWLGWSNWQSVEEVPGEANDIRVHTESGSNYVYRFDPSTGRLSEATRSDGSHRQYVRWHALKGVHLPDIIEDAPKQGSPYRVELTRVAINDALSRECADRFDQVTAHVRERRTR